jgi:FAD/FMN-containing dehydrogenase
VTAEPGVPPAMLAHAVAPTHSFTLDHAGTLGGAAASGLLGAALIALDLVIADGTLLSLTPRSVGYDIPAAFGGSYGSGGIAVSLTVRTVPLP